MAQADNYDTIDDPGMLRDLLRHRDQTIAELRSELDEANDLIRRFDEYEDDFRATIESYRDIFHMAPADDDSGWTNAPFLASYHGLVDRYNDLRKRWNKAVPILNAGMKDIGRPLAASEAQIVEVISSHMIGDSLREIVEATSLSMQTVRTIVGRQHGTDRTTKVRKQKVARIEIDKLEQAHWKRQKRDGDALPKRVQAVIETGQALVKEAKGLGRGR